MGLIGLIILIGLCYYACKKRASHTYRCPKCGTMCNASPWSTGLRYTGGRAIHSYKCRHCGNEFYD